MTTAVHRVIGRPIPQPEGAAKVTGDALYTADVVLPGVLWAKILRSQLPHARIRAIDVSKARALPGVYAVITAADLPETNYGRRIKDLPPLARGVVRFVGEKVAAVAAQDSATADAALKLIEIDYEELPAVFDPIEAMAETAPRVHDELGYEGYLEPPPPIANVYTRNKVQLGDIESGFSEADVIVEQTFTTPSQHHAYLEPHSAMVEIDDDGRVHVWLCNKTPHTGRQQMAALIGLPEERIVMHVSQIGGDFGGKGSVMDAPVCYYLAKATGRPVKVVMDYMEEFTAGNPRHPSLISIKAGVKRDGRFTAWQMKVVMNTGAYAAFLPGGGVGGARTGPYIVPNVEGERLCVYTNCTPRGHMRAPGTPQAVFAIESFVDLAARAVNMDPIEFRLRNLPESEKARETLNAAAKAAGWHEPKAKNRGRGLSFFSHGTGSGMASVALAMNAEGEAELYAAAPDTGTGAHTILQQIVAEELTLPLDQITIVCRDTESTNPDSGVGGSRVSRVYGQATFEAAQEMRSRLLAGAARILETPVQQVSLSQGYFRPDPATGNNGEQPLSIADVARQLIQESGELIARAEYGQIRDRTPQPARPAEAAAPARAPAAPPALDEGGTSYCAQIAEVEVDPETGETKVVRFVSAHDVGTILNPLSHQGQINGGVAQGLGYALMEEIVIEDGRVVNPHFGEYKIPTIRDMPEMITVLLEAPAGPVPYQGKAIGEVSNCPVAPAVANAVFDAAGVRIPDLPITSKKVYERIKSR